MHNPDRKLLSQLLQIVSEIYERTEAYQQNPHDTQQWYDRGYADGIVEALHALGYGSVTASLVGPETPDLSTLSRHLPWGEAYHHGRRMGERETKEVLGPA